MKLTHWMMAGALLVSAGAAFSQSAPIKTRGGAGQSPLTVGVEPFSSIAVAVKVGSAGIGIDLATPVASKLNLRVGASFFSYNPNLVVDGINIVGNINLRSVSENFDFFPFGNAFRVSPGITFYNGNHITATALVAGGQNFTLDDFNFISSPADPVHGTFDMSFGHQLAPSLTIGFGNMIPRKGGHWSFPFEIGGEYIGQKPRIALALGGSACMFSTAPGFCQPITSTPQLVQDVQGEQALLNGDIPTQLRFFPIVSTGVSYRFGRSGSR
jgi:hypothetical protein